MKTSTPVLAMRGHPSFWHGTARKRCLPANKMREAERRQAHTHYKPRHMRRRYRLNMLRARRAPRRCDVAAAMRFGRARLSALRRGFPRAALGCTRFGPGRASREREERALPDHRSRLSQAPGTPTVMSRGVDTRTARERSVSLRPQEPHSLRLKEHPRDRHPSGASGADST